jgi:hypothetical protein
LADFTTTTAEPKFSVHTPDLIYDRHRQIEVAVDALIKAEEFFHECNDETPNIVAARIMIGLTNDCQMAIALVVARGLVPSLSGLIREHAAFFVANPALPLSGMPFAPA